MAQYIKTRGGDQCRTHHQKMLEKYQNIDNIIEMIQTKRKRARQKINQQKADLNRDQIIDLTSQ